MYSNVPLDVHVVYIEREIYAVNLYHTFPGIVSRAVLSLTFTKQREETNYFLVEEERTLLGVGACVSAPRDVFICL